VVPAVTYPCVICGETAQMFLHDGYSREQAMAWPNEKKRKACVCKGKECSKALRERIKK